MSPEDFFMSVGEVALRLMVLPTDTSSLACFLNLLMIKEAWGEKVREERGGGKWEEREGEAKRGRGEGREREGGKERGRMREKEQERGSDIKHSLSL